MTETQAERISKELRTIRICMLVVAAIVAVAPARMTFHL